MKTAGPHTPFIGQSLLESLRAPDVVAPCPQREVGLCTGFDGRACAVERADDGSHAVAVSGMDRLGECFSSKP